MKIIAPPAITSVDEPFFREARFAAAASFSALVAAAGGRHPSELLDLLVVHEGQDPALQARARSLIEDAIKLEPSGGLPQGAGLALPHPMDAEWRFTDQTAEDILDAAADMTNAGDVILLMGVPTVVVAAKRSSHDRIFSVVGEHNIIFDKLSVRRQAI